MKGKLITILSVIALIVVLLDGMVWYSHNQMNQQMFPMDNASGNGSNTANTEPTLINDHNYATNLIQPREGQPIKDISLVAEESTIEISKGVFRSVSTFGGTVPGTEIRVNQGDFVNVKLINTLPEPVTIHWHGYPVISAMDGIPGVTQDAVRPGESFTYQFSADIPGTYWYHSHQEGAKQVDKGLYAALVVIPKDETTVDRDYTLILDEWMSDPNGGMEMGDTGNSNMAGMSDMAGMDDMSGQTVSDPVMDEEKMMASQYDIYTVNGKSGSIIEPLDVEKGDVVRLRFINAGYRTHGIHIPGEGIKIVSTDGQAIMGASEIKDQIISVSPGERYDVEFTVQNENSFIIDSHDSNLYNAQIKIPVDVIDGSGSVQKEISAGSLPAFDLMTYGTPAKGPFTLEQKYDVNYRVELDTDTTGNSLKYTINGKVFSDLPPLELKKEQLVKFTIINKSKVDHPMHLHGHFFQVLSRNTKPYTGAVIMKDTLLIKPGETYVVSFVADNPGLWVQHCHELHHAAGGMMQKIVYTDYLPNYKPDPNNTFNKPE